MASASGGVDWAAVIKPIFAASYGSYNKSDVLELIKAINKRYEIVNHNICCHKTEVGFVFHLFRHDFL